MCLADIELNVQLALLSISVQGHSGMVIYTLLLLQPLRKMIFVLAALLFATISQGGLAVNALVPKQFVEVLQAVVIIAVAVSVPPGRTCRKPTTDGAVQNRDSGRWQWPLR